VPPQVDPSKKGRSQPEGYSGVEVEEKWWFTLWLSNIAMENDPFIDGLPIKNGDFPWLC